MNFSGPIIVKLPPKSKNTPKRDIPEVEPPKLDETTGLIAINPDEPLPWNYKENWIFWSLRNLQDANRLKILTPYLVNGSLDRGIIPRALFADMIKKDPRKFPYFAILPQELKDMIWEYALDHEHLEHVVTLDYERIFGHKVNTRFTLQSCGPRLLHVNRNCRELALKRYVSILGTEHTEPMTLTNPRMDRIFFHTVNSAQFPKMIKCIKHEDVSFWLSFSLSHAA